MEDLTQHFIVRAICSEFEVSYHDFCIFSLKVTRLFTVRFYNPRTSSQNDCSKAVWHTKMHIIQNCDCKSCSHQSMEVSCYFLTGKLSPLYPMTKSDPFTFNSSPNDKILD